MLQHLQRQLNDTYCLGDGYDVRDFVVTDATLAKALGQGKIAADSQETLLMSQQDDELLLSLFLDAELLERVEECDPLQELRADMLDDLCQVVEGISHFCCAAWKAAENRTLSLLELEIQGEVDKFVATMQLAIAQADDHLRRSLHNYLFENVRFRDGLNERQLARYRAAHNFAARYCYRLKERLREGDALDELRQFYRLQLGDKISHMRAASFDSARIT